jgi:heme A synthase
MVVGAWRLYGRTHRVWQAALIATAFLVLEILLGAALVLFGWVEDNASWGRVIADSFHVVNTFMLAGSILIVAWFAGERALPRIDTSRRVDRILLLSGGIVLLIAITGTIDSLADTLALSDSVNIDETPIAAILVSVRGIHPILAISGGLGIFYLLTQLRDVAPAGTVRLLMWIQAVIGVQFIVGILNIALLTPLETQIVHLILADTLWLSLLFVGMRLLSSEQTPAKRSQAAV